MTRPDHDPMRALDGLQPPDQWDDIVARSATVEVDLAATGTANTLYRRLLVAAVVLAVIGLGGVVALTVRSGNAKDSQAITADEGGESGHTSIPSDGAAGTVLTTPDGSVVTTTTTDGGDGATNGNGSGSGSGNGNGNGTGSGHTGVSGGDGHNSGSTTIPNRITTTTAGSTASTTVPVTIAPTTTLTPDDGAPPSGGVDGFWEHKWTVTSLAEGGSSLALGGRALVLDASVEGHISMAVCNRLSGATTIDGVQLDVSLDPITALTCGDPIDANEAFLSALLQGSPTVSVSGNHLTLTSGNRKAEFSS